MSDYPNSYIAEVNHAMLYEVGGFWNLGTPGTVDGTNAHACGYGNDPTDPGGETKYGIAKNANPDLDIHSLDWDAAMRIYYRRYWLTGHCDVLTVNMPRLAALHFDGTVNNGLGKAAKFLQTAAGVAADGDIGPGTLGAVAALDEITLCNAICDQRAAYYNAIVKARPDQVKYLGGWMRRINEMRTFVTSSTNIFT